MRAVPAFFVLAACSPSQPVDTSAQSACDINGDGYADLVGVSPRPPEGRAELRVFLGGPGGLETEASFTAESESAYGLQLVCPGDVDGDGYADIVAGTDLVDTPPPAYMQTGGGYLHDAEFWPGGASGLGERVVLSEDGGADYSDTGSRVAGLGDFNGDGRPDFAVFQTSPSLMIWLGGERPEPTPDVLIDASDSLDGQRMVWFWPAGDVDGDGMDDVVARLSDESSYVVVFGGEEAPYRVEAFEEAVGTPFGGNNSYPTQWARYVLGPADVTGDGQVDLVTTSLDGAWFDVYEGTGSSYLPPLSGALRDEPQGYTHDQRMALGGDVNGDGAEDVLLVMKKDAADISALDEVAFAVQIQLGQERIDEAPNRLLIPDEQDPWPTFEYDIPASGLGDVDGDGFGDVAVYSSGKWWVWHGRRGGPRGRPDQVIEGLDTPQIGRWEGMR